jgi:SAM-dependent methyltransferase
MPGTSAADPEDHDHAHGGHREPGNDALHWNERYAATDRLWSAEPNRTVEEVVGPLPPGRALDLGAGEGRHAVWLARRGWRVTAVDFSALGIEAPVPLGAWSGSWATSARGSHRQARPTTWCSLSTCT